MTTNNPETRFRFLIVQAFAYNWRGDEQGTWAFYVEDSAETFGDALYAYDNLNYSHPYTNYYIVEDEEAPEGADLDPALQS